MGKISASFLGNLENNKYFNMVGEIIIPAKSLRQMPTVTTLASPGYQNSLALAHVVDGGTDCLVVEVASWVGSAVDGRAISVTWGAQSLSVAATVLGLYSGVGVGSQIWYLKNPTPGSNTITITYTNNPASTAIASNWQGTAATPFRAASTAVSAASITSISVAPVSVVGDIVLDSISIAGNWAMTGGQTLIAQVPGYLSSPYGEASQKAGAAGTTTMSWGGADASSVALVGAALAGS